MKKNETNIGMELTLDGLGETLRVIGTGEKGTALFIGNEYDNSKVSICLDDLSQVQNKEPIERLGGLVKVVSEAHEDIKKLAIETYKNEWMVEGALDEVGETERVA